MDRLPQYYIFGYSDYIKNSLLDILKLPNVHYYETYHPDGVIKRVLNRVFVSRYSRILSSMLMPVCKNLYWQGNRPCKEEMQIFILYEINPLSNKQQWIREVKKDYPNSKIVYIFTNIIDEHRKWRIEQINRHRELYDLILTFNEKDAEQYNMDYYEGVFSSVQVSRRLIDDAEMSDVYFCGLDKGRLPFLLDIYKYLTSNGVKCIFDIIFADESRKEEHEGIQYHEDLINNQAMLARVIKSKCILEAMVDTTQPGSSLRMCEAVAFKKKLLTNNPFAKDKPFFSSKQMQYYSDATDIDISFIYKELGESDFLDDHMLSPMKLLDYMERKLVKNEFDR